MTKNNYKFSNDELKIFLFKKKTCPNCGNQELIRRKEKVYKGQQRSTGRSTNLMHEDVYENTFIYECQECNRKYNLLGLRDNIELGDNDSFSESNKIVDDYPDERRTSLNRRNKKMVMKFANVWVVFSTLLLFIIAKQDQNFIIMLIFMPFIIMVYLVFRFFGR